MLSLNRYTFTPPFKGSADGIPASDSEKLSNSKQTTSVSKNQSKTTIGNSYLGRDLVSASKSQRRRIPLEKVDVDDFYAKVALTKIQKYLKMLPAGSKLTKPLCIKFGEVATGKKVCENNLAIFINKTDPNKMKVTARTFVEDMTEWALEDGYKGDSLSCVFDKDGRMIYGDMIFTDAVTKAQKSYGRALHFERSGNNRRTIDIGGATYIPEKGNRDNWQKVESTVVNELYPMDSRNVSDYFSEPSSPLMEIFKVLTRKDTSILV